MTFDELGLAAPLLRAVKEKGYTEPSPIQVEAIPAVLAGRDIMAAAQTGTGKTAGFVLPILQLLSATAPAHPHRLRALIITPTRELAAQVQESVVIGQETGHDVRVVLFVRLREGALLDETLAERIRRQIRASTTPRHVPAKILQVPDIPRTLSGKVVELAVREAVHGRPVKNTDALANPDALEHFRNRPELSG